MKKIQHGSVEIWTQERKRRVARKKGGDKRADTVTNKTHVSLNRIKSSESRNQHNNNNKKSTQNKRTAQKKEVHVYCTRTNTCIFCPQASVCYDHAPCTSQKQTIRPPPISTIPCAICSHQRPILCLQLTSLKKEAGTTKKTLCIRRSTYTLEVLDVVDKVFRPVGGVGLVERVDL